MFKTRSFSFSLQKVNLNVSNVTVITILLFALSNLLKTRTLTIVATRSIKLQILQVLFKFLKTILYYYKLQEQVHFHLTKSKQRI